MGRRPCRFSELLLLVAHEAREGRVELLEPAVEADDGKRLRRVVEARLGLALGGFRRLDWTGERARARAAAAARGEAEDLAEHGADLVAALLLGRVGGTRGTQPRGRSAVALELLDGADRGL